jgi:hypothetical protein
MRHIDTSRLTSLRRRNLGKKPLDTSRLTSLRRRNIGRRPLLPRTLDTSRLTSLRRNMDASRLMAFRRNLRPYSTSNTGFRNNPDWGPTLYNPLEDDDHAFKDDSHYERTIAKLRRRNPVYSNTCPSCGLRRNPEEGTGLFRSIYSRNPDYALRAVTGTNSATGSPGQALYRSLFARRNPPQSIETATNSPIGQGLFTSIFSRHNPVRNWSRPRHLRRRWGTRRFDESSFYGV